MMARSGIGGKCIGIAVGLTLTLAGCGASPATATPPSKSPPFPLTASNPPFATSMDFLSMRQGFVGVNSSVMSTSNGGQSWTKHPLPHGETASAMAFVTPTLGWVLAQGPNGSHPTVSLLKTTDGGQRWTTQLMVHTNISGNLCITTHGGYAIIGKKLYTTPNSTSGWRSTPLPQNAIPTAVSAAASDAWVAALGGSHDQLFSTTDRGAHFTSIYTTPDSIDGISLTSPSTGHLLLGLPGGYEGPLGPLVATTNGGHSWSSSAIPANGFYAGMNFPPGPDAWIATTNGAQGVMSSGLMVTSDNGGHWTSIGPKRGWQLRASSMVAPGQGFVLGMSSSGTPFVAKTTDNGVHWTQVWPEAVPISTDFVSARHGYGLGIADNRSAIFVTHDGGLHWALQNARPGATFNHVSYWKNRGLAISQTYDAKGQSIVDVYRTTNQGMTWQRIGAIPTALSLGITMLGPTHAILATFGKTYASTNAGQSWSLLSRTTLQPGKTSSTKDFIGIHHSWAFSSPNAWGHGAHLDFVDHGTSKAIYTWPGNPKTLYISGTTVDFLNRQVGWIVLQKMVRSNKTFTKPGSRKKFFVTNTVNQLIKTTNGGRTWTEEITFPANLSITSGPHFVNDQVGFMTINNQVLTTKDGGHIWTLVQNQNRHH